jgi:hypothetical protein
MGRKNSSERRKKKEILRQESDSADESDESDETPHKEL